MTRMGNIDQDQVCLCVYNSLYNNTETTVYVIILE